MGKIKDLSGQRFGKLVALSICGRNKNNAVIWLCKCDCGNYVEVLSISLIAGHTKSCGCMKGYKKKHGDSGSRLYRVWISMKQRCQNSKNKAYQFYGGKGIKVCEEWNNYSCFKQWAIKNGYDDMAKNKECTLDRIDVNGDYEPLNCRWVSMAEQNRNKSYHRYVVYQGKKLTVTQLAKKVGMNKETLVYRLNAGWTVDDAINKPIKSHKNLHKADMRGEEV